MRQRTKLLSHFVCSEQHRKNGKIVIEKYLKKIRKNCKKMLTIVPESDNINELSQDRASDQQKSFLEKKKVVDKVRKM